MFTNLSLINNFPTSAKCKFRISEEIQTCSNDACPIQGQPLQATTGFDLLLDISDHTGTVQSCNLAGTVAEKTLGCKVSASNTCFNAGQDSVNVSSHLNFYKYFVSDKHLCAVIPQPSFT